MADPWGQAEAQVAVKYDPQQAAINRQLETARSQTAANEASLNQYGNTGRQIIGDTFNTLYGLLGANKTDTQNALNQQLALTNQGYDKAIGDIQGYQNASRDYIANMAAQLGQSGQGLVSSGNLEDVVNRELGYASSARANYGSTLGDWIAKMGSLADMGISSAHQSEALRKSNFEADLLQAIGQNKLAGTNQETDLMNKLTDIMGLRQSDLVAMYNQLQAEEWDRQFKQAQLNEQAAEASAELGYKYAALNQSAAEGAANRAAQGQLSLKDLWGMMQSAQSREDQLKQNEIENAQGWARINKGSPEDIFGVNDVGNLITSGLLPGGTYDDSTGTWSYSPEAMDVGRNLIGQPMSAYQRLINSVQNTAAPQSAPSGGTNYAGNAAKSAVNWGKSGGGFSLNFAKLPTYLNRAFTMAR